MTINLMKVCCGYSILASVYISIIKLLQKELFGIAVATYYCQIHSTLYISFWKFLLKVTSYMYIKTSRVGVSDVGTAVTPCQHINGYQPLC